MTTSVDIRLLVGVACTLLVLSLCLAAYLRNVWTERFRLAITLYGASLASLTVSAAGVFLSQSAPFVISTMLLIAGAHFGIVLAYLSVHEALRPQRSLRPALLTATCLCLAQGVLSVVFQDAAMLIVSSSVVNGTVALLAGGSLWKVASVTSPRIRLLIAAPFYMIATAYLVRLALLTATDPSDWFVMASSGIAFVLGVASLYLGFVLIIIRETALADDLRLAREQAEDAMRQRTRFFSQINHELRTPLNGILGLTRMLSVHVQGPAGAKTLRDLQSSAALLKTVVDDVLDFAKLDTGAVQLEIITFDLPDAVGRTVQQYQTLAADKGVSFRYDAALGPSGWRTGDPTRLTQVLHNILTNAIKFTSKGEITVSVQQTEGDIVKLTIADTGIGMDADQLRSLFEPFRQATASTARQFGGTGLGMSIVKMLVDAMGGTITVQSAPGQGTKIDLLLPLAVAEPPPAGTGKESLPPVATINHGSLRILCADDDEINRLVLHAFLAELAVEPVMADSGAEAITLAQGAEFDAYLIDINMPGLGGVETLAALREIDAQRDGPSPLAVAVTANVMQEDIRSYLHAGFDAHLPKPIVFEDLSAVLVRAQDRLRTAHLRPVRSRSTG
jgi:signal transduction histidine kinase/ActR/RegA family two-component response regulator